MPTAKEKLERFLTLYYKYCLFPIALALLLFGSWGVINNPQGFMVQTIDCYGNSIDCEPAVAKGFHIMGLRVSEGFDIPVVSREEFEVRKARYDNMNTWLMIVGCLIVVGLFQKYKSYVMRFDGGVNGEKERFEK